MKNLSRPRQLIVRLIIINLLLLAASAIWYTFAPAADSVAIASAKNKAMRDMNLMADFPFDAATIGFGVRNFADIQKGMSEICRVLRPGGMCVVLEPAAPKVFPFKQLFNFYFKRVLPLIGKITYLNRWLPFLKWVTFRAFV